MKPRPTIRRTLVNVARKLQASDHDLYREVRNLAARFPRVEAFGPRDAAPGKIYFEKSTRREDRWWAYLIEKTKRGTWKFLQVSWDEGRRVPGKAKQRSGPLSDFAKEVQEKDVPPPVMKRFKEKL